VRFFDDWLERVRQISLWAAWFGGSLITISVFIISLEVILRKVFGRSLGGADEISSYALAIGSSWAFAYALFERSHIRVDVVYSRLSRGARAGLDLLSLLILAVVILLLTRYAYDVFATSYIRGATANTPLGTPLWWPQGFWLVGLIWFLFVDIAIFLRGFFAFVHGDLETIERLAGSHVMEIGEELEGGANVENGEV